MCPILFRIGPFALHTYGLMVASGFLIAFSVARRCFRQAHLPPEMLDSLVFYIMVAALLGARLLYFGVDNFVDLRNNPWSFFRIWEGGLVFFGGMIGGLVALVIYSMMQGYPLIVLTDALAAPLLIGQAIGRLGCFAAGCCYGKPTALRIGVIFTNPESLAPKFVRLLPTQLFSSWGDFLLFLAALALLKRRPRRGVMTAFYLMGYGVFRFLIEFLRGDDRGIFYNGLSPSQWISLGAVLAGAIVMIYARHQRDT